MTTALIVFVLLAVGLSAGFVAGCLASHINTLKQDQKLEKANMILALQKEMQDFVENNLGTDMPGEQYYAVLNNKQYLIDMLEAA